MQLHSRSIGTGKKHLIVLHGLYGSGDNWLSIAKHLPKSFTIHLPDLRNHGKSPHSSTHNYQAMCADIYEYVISIGAKKVSLLGHSMGGKLAMFFSSKYPNLVEKLIVVDISPRPYTQQNTDNEHILFHVNLFNTLIKIDISKCKSIAKAKEILTQKIDNPKLIGFLLKNVKKTDDEYHWRLNINSLQKNLLEIMEGLDINKYDYEKIEIPSLFLKGMNSDYISKKDKEIIEHIFTNFKIVNIPNSGHWMHAEQPKLVISEISKFL